MSNLLRTEASVFSEQTLIQDGRRINICSMKAAHQSLSRTEESLIRTQTRVETEVQRMMMHCGYIFFLFVALWAELAAGMALLTATTDPDMQSTIENLQAALDNYSSILKEAPYLKDLLVLPCTDTAAQLEQSSTVARKLSEYQVCAKQLGSFCPDTNALCQVVMLNNDLLQHLNESYEDSARCPPSSPTSSTPSDFPSIFNSIQCVDCWSKQVAALRR